MRAIKVPLLFVNVLSRKYGRGSALIIILSIVTLLTVLVLTFLITAQFERRSSGLSLDHAQAEALADFAEDTAMARLRDAIDTGRQPGYTWASEPGRIWIFQIASGSGAVTPTSRDMFSALPGPDSTITPDLNNVDLNKPSVINVYPIATPASGAGTASMKVGWINMLTDQSQTASSSNRIVGRIAYWVDDDSCKININTADGSKVDLNTGGSQKTNFPQSYQSGIQVPQSYGFGTPSEISLAPLLNSYNNDSPAALWIPQASAIATYATNIGFNSASEIGRVANLPSGFSYEQNKFSLTHVSRSPDINMFGEPRIQLFPTYPAIGTAQGESLNMMTGAYASYYLASYGPAGSAPYYPFYNVSGSSAGIYPVNHVYPTSSQLPKMILPGGTSVSLPQYPGQFNYILRGGIDNTTNPNYNLGLRIANYLNGKDSQGNAITWPQFPGATVNGFAGKYSLRQRDSIALNILDYTSGAAMADQCDGFSEVSWTDKGFLGNDLVSGFGRGPKLTEIRIAATFDPSGGNPTGAGPAVPYLQFSVVTELYMPKYFLGAPISLGVGGTTHNFYSNISQWDIGKGDPPQTLNWQDTAPEGYYTGVPTGPSPMGGYWANQILQMVAQDGSPSGIDETCNPSMQVPTPPSTDTHMPDPDQADASLYHSYCYYAPPPPASPFYIGSNFNANSLEKADPLLAMERPGGSGMDWNAGIYHETESLGTRGSVYWARATPPMTGLQIQGGLVFWTQDQSGSLNQWEFAPLDGFHGPTTYYLNEAPAKALAPNCSIPINIPSFSGPITYDLQVADPLVNKFPGDWVVQSQSGSAPDTLDTGPASLQDTNIAYAAGGTTAINNNDPAFPCTGTSLDEVNGDNFGYQPANGGDPLSVVSPNQDINMPKQAIVPSVGALNFIRTGIIPDTGIGTSSAAGTPWRCLSFASSSSPGQATSLGSYPDWAMLDLFTVPFLPQPPAMIGNAQVPPRLLTYGGATEGRLNINNPAIPYPFSLTISGVAQNPPARTIPLESLFYGWAPSSSYDGSGNPVYSTVDPVALTTAVQSYLQTNEASGGAGPFMIPGELANVPAINAYTYHAYSVDNSGTKHDVYARNDLMRDVVGALTTQSNVYSIWVVTQTIAKSPANTGYGTYETGDTVTGEVRRHYIVERYIDPGKDGVPGNANNPGNDGSLNTEDDPIDPYYHPAMTYPLPYRWRILSVENVAK